MLVYVDNLRKRKIIWDFYALGDDLDPQLCKFDPFVPEQRRVAKLYLSLSRGFQLEKNWCSCEVEYLDDRRLFCEFSGGGDLLFTTSQRVLCTELSHEINSYDVLQFQPMADMIIGCVKSFVDLLSKQPTLEHLQHEVLSTYGIACTGAGTVGLVKLEIDFTAKAMRFLDKVPLQTFLCRSTSAALDDLIITHVASSTSTQP